MQGADTIQDGTRDECHKSARDSVTRAVCHNERCPIFLLLQPVEVSTYDISGFPDVDQFIEPIVNWLKARENGWLDRAGGLYTVCN